MYIYILNSGIMFCYCFLFESVDTCSQPLESSTSTHVIITIDIMSVILYDFISGPRSKSALLTPLTSRATIHIIAYLSCIYIVVYVSISLVVNFRFLSDLDCRVRVCGKSTSYVSFVVSDCWHI